MQSGLIHLPRDNSYLPELWTWYALAVVIIFLRFVVRIRTVGFRGFQADDYLAILIIYDYGTHIDVKPAIIDQLTIEDVERLTFGSKFEFASWYTYPALIWSMKLSMLCVYKRLTLGTIGTNILPYLFWLCGITGFALLLTISLSCQPYSHNWQVRPLPKPECVFKPQNFYVLVVLNVLTDAIILCVPIPLLWKLRVSIIRRLAITVLLSSGLFVIAAAIIRAVLTLGKAPSALNINRWGVRETLVSLFAVTAPVFPPILTREFWRRGKYERPPHNNREIGQNNRLKCHLSCDTGSSSRRLESSGDSEKQNGSLSTMPPGLAATAV